MKAELLPYRASMTTPQGMAIWQRAFDQWKKTINDNADTIVQAAQVDNIDSPDLSSYKGEVYGNVLIAYDANYFTGYAWKTSGVASSPFVVTGDGGFWEAVFGRYINTAGRVNSLTASRLMASDADKGLVSTDLFNWFTVDITRISLADDLAGGVSISLPDDPLWTSGIAGGQSAYGGTGDGESLNFYSTYSLVKGTINLGNTITVNEGEGTITFNLTPNPVNEEGEVWWDATDRTLNIYTGIGNILQVGQEQFGIGVNKTGDVTSDGKVVYFSGVQGNRPTFDYADASDGSKISIIGVCTTANGNNEEEAITTFGFVRNFDTSAWVAGTLLYVAADGTGTMTSTAPSAPNYRVRVGVVTNQHATQGSMFVFPGIDYADGVTLHSLYVVTDSIFGGNIVLPKTSGYGTKVDTVSPSFGFRDIEGWIKILSPGANDPTLAVFRDSLRQFSFSNAAMNEVFVSFHIPHDYVAASDIYLHFHWSQNVVDTGGPAGVPGDVKWQAEVSYAKGHDQAAFPASFVTFLTDTASATQYQHMISELQLSAAAPSATQIDSDILEPDGLILVRVFRDPTDVADTLDQVPFLHHADLHYQSTNIATKAKAPDFYT